MCSFATSRVTIRSRQPRATSCLQRLQGGDEQATTCEAIITEVVYVLCARSHYGLQPTEIRARLGPILALRGLRLPHKRMYLRALDLYATYPGLDFEAVLIISQMEGVGEKELYSYNSDVDGIPTVTRIEPAPE